MRKLTCITSVLLALSTYASQAQQTDGDAGTGFPQNGVFAGSSIESVQINNGNLHVEIPVWSYTGRGGLESGVSFVYDSKGWELFQLQQGTNFTNDIGPETGNTLQLALYTKGSSPTITHQLYGAGSRQTYTCNGTTYPYEYLYAFVVREPNGTKHHMVPDNVNAGSPNACIPAGSTMYADDGSGVVLDNKVLVLGKDGTQNASKDRNGNFLSGNGTQVFTDTLGRNYYTDGSYIDSSGTRRYLTITTEQVTVSTHLCGSFSPCAEYPATWTVPHIITLPNGLSYTINYLQNAEGEISSITFPTGATVSYTYGQPDFAGQRVLTRTVTVGGQSSTWTYSYTNVATVNPQTITVTDQLGNKTVSTCTPGTSGLTQTGFTAPTPASCWITEADTSNSSGTVLKKVATSYVGAGGPVLPTKITTTLPETNQVSEVDLSYDSQTIQIGEYENVTTGPMSWGNIADKYEYDYGAGARGALLRHTHSDYLHLPSSDPNVSNPNWQSYQNLNIANEPVSKIVYDGSGNALARSYYEYDLTAVTSTNDAATNHDHAYDSSFNYRGNLSKKSDWINTSGSLVATTTYTYDDLGNRLSEVDPNNHTTTYSYQDNFDTTCATGTTYAFLKQITDALNHPTLFYYNSCTGLRTQSRDANDIAASRNGTQYSYDLMNRLLTTTYPDTGSVTRNYNNDTLPLTVTTTTAATPDPPIVKSTVYDGLGRVQNTKLQTDPGVTVEVDTSYDVLGHVASVSNPYHPGDQYGVTYYIYDALDRKSQQTQQDNNKQYWGYNGNAVTFQDESGSQWQRTSDGLGRLTQVLEPGSSSRTPTVETDYTYDALDNLLSVTQKGTSGETARTRSFTYDSLRRLVTAANPETGTICYGTYTGGVCGNGYDAVGNLLKKTDARGITLTYGYDNVNRMTAKSSSDGTLSYTYNYDATDGNSESNPLGRLTFASNQVNAAESYSYDPMGRVIRSTYCVPQDCHYDIAVSAIYDLAGRPTSITYPDTRTVSQGYNGAGQISSVGYKSWGGTSIGSSYLTVPDAGGYDAAGHLTSATMGNGVQLASTYNLRETVASLGYTLGTTSLWSKQYSWYPNENLQLITDAISGVQRQFTYDDVNRLQTVEDLAGTSGSTGETTATSDEAEENVLSGGSQIWGSTTATITANAAAAPDGTQTATVVSVTAGTTDHFNQAAISDPSLYDGAAFSATVWLKVPSGTLATSIYIVQIGDQGWSIAGQTAVTLTTSWQQFTVSGTLQNGLTAVSFQLAGAHTITGGQVYDVWGAEMGPGTASGGVVTNILPSSELVAGSSWVINNGSVTNNALAAPDNTNTAATVTGNSGSIDTYLVDYLQNPSQYSGKTVTASVYLRVSSGTQILNLYVANGGASGFSLPGMATVTLNTSWQRFEVTATNQAGLSFAYFQIGGGGTMTAGQSICVWGAQMVVGSSQGAYVETQNATTVTGSPQTLAANGLNEVYSYDSFGNLQSTGNYNFIQAYTAANQISGWTYDAAGNLLYDGLGNGYQYNPEGMIKSGAGASYVYTAEGQRAEKSGATVVDTIYFGGRPIARLSGGAWTDLIYGPGGLVAEVPGTQTGAPVYRMTDHLGSLVGTLSSTGSVLSTQDVAPFGEVFSGSSSDAFVFTGKERDAESGNDYFGARYYSSNMGRWMSPDWASSAEAVPYSDFSDPQSLNLYSYVRNNPTSRSDADGHAPEQGNSNGWWDPSSFNQFVRDSMNGGNHATNALSIIMEAQQQNSTQRRESAAEARAKENMQKYGGSQPADKGLNVSPVAGSCGGGNHTCQYSLSGAGSEGLYVYEHQTSGVLGGQQVGDSDYVTPGRGYKANTGIFYDDIGGSSLDTYRFFTVSKSPTYNPADQMVVPIRESGGLIGFEHMYSTGGAVYINGSTNISPQN